MVGADGLSREELCEVSKDSYSFIHGVLCAKSNFLRYFMQSCIDGLATWEASLKGILF